MTPIIRDVAGRTQMVVSGSMSICSYDPRTGKRFWKIDGPTEQFVASMVFDGKLFYMAAGFPTHHVMAVRPEGNGNVTETHVAWHETNKVGCYVPSPVLAGDYLIVADDNGTANCFEAKTGERQWRARLGNHYSASLVTANGLAYLLADDGTTKVIRPGAYGMTELLAIMPRCEHGRYHQPASLIWLLLDQPGERLLGPEDGEHGIVEGRFAFLDLSYEGRWGGLISGDKVQVDFKSTCACGRPGPTILDSITRYSQGGADDHIGCAGTIDAYIKGQLAV